MTDAEEVRHYADAIMTMIREDQDTGQVPRGVSSWDELDESVDENDYYQQAGVPTGTHEASELRDAVGEEINRRLSGSQGGPWRVTWTHPEGAAHDISRSVGYATQAEAEMIGQDYFMAHGGTYQVEGG